MRRSLLLSRDDELKDEHDPGLSGSGGWKSKYLKYSFFCFARHQMPVGFVLLSHGAGVAEWIQVVLWMLLSSKRCRADWLQAKSFTSTSRWACQELSFSTEKEGSPPLHTGTTACVESDAYYWYCKGTYILSILFSVFPFPTAVKWGWSIRQPPTRPEGVPMAGNWCTPLDNVYHVDETFLNNFVEKKTHQAIIHTVSSLRMYKVFIQNYLEK